MRTETRICDCCGDIVNTWQGYVEVHDGERVLYLVDRCMEPFLKVVLEQPRGTPLLKLLEITRRRIGA